MAANVLPAPSEGSFGIRAIYTAALAAYVSPSQ